MPQGLIVYDAAGNVVYDGTSSQVKYLGSFNIGKDYTGAQQSGTLTEPRFTSLGLRPFVGSLGSFDPDFMPTLTISGDTLTWTYLVATYTGFERPDWKIIYGVF